MAILRNKLEHPPGDFVYTVMETKAKIEGENFRDLVSKVMSHRAYKGLSPTDYDSVALDCERQICQSLSLADCLPEPGEDYRPVFDESRYITLSKILAFSAASIEWLTGKGEMVSEAEAQRRTEICRGCPFNKQAASCSCGPLYKLIDMLIPKNRRMSGLHICSACGCNLMLKSVSPDSVIRASNAGRTINFPAYCWQKAILSSP